MSLSLKIVIVLLSILAIVSGGKQIIKAHDAGVRAEQKELDQKEVDAVKAEARQTLDKERAKVAEQDQALRDMKDQQELLDDKHQEKVADLKTQLARIAGPAQRLRDPNAAKDSGCRNSGGSATKDLTATASLGSGGAAQTGGLLSAELTRLLLQLTKEADDINNAYASCRADGQAVRLTTLPASAPVLLQSAGPQP